LTVERNVLDTYASMCAATDLPNTVSLPLDEVQALMLSCLRGTPLEGLTEQNRGLLQQGKMLRSRLALRLGLAQGIDPRTLIHASAAIEVIHAASLLHDDVIDGGLLRRGVPSFWREKGVAGAVLLGDMLLVKGLSLVGEVEDGRLTNALVRFAGEVCQGEAEQELIYRHRESTWEDCVRLARLKTGALFAFAGLAAAGTEPERQTAFTEAGYELGTAYQLADDLLDAVGDASQLGKTLGTDQARHKVTAVSFLPAGHDPRSKIEALCQQARARLSPWPKAQSAWDEYVQLDFNPSARDVFEKQG